MNYEDKSNFEVNQAVALKIRGSDEVSIIQHLGLVNIFCGNPKDEDNSSWRRFDPCNNPSDAWPIIVGGKIAIDFIDGYGWTANPAFNCSISVSCHDEPLRSAMICFLKMKDAESE